MAEDQANSKELVLGAIQVLRDKGAEVNPYTVANEAKLPRSTIYRNAELMDLISREKTEPAEKLAAKQAGFPDRVAELEAENEELGQTIWNLEKQNEELQKDFHDAWTMGFAAGLEEANKRHARGIVGAPAPMVESAWPSVDRNAAQGEGDSFAPEQEQKVIYTPAPSSTDSSPFITPVISPVAPPSGASPADLGYDTAPNVQFGADASRAPSSFQAASAESLSQSMNAIIDFTTAAETAAAESAAAAPSAADLKIDVTPTPVAADFVDVGPVISDRVIFADPPGDEGSFFGEEMGLSQDYLYSPEVLDAPDTRMYNRSDSGAATNTRQPRSPGANAPAYSLDLSQGSQSRQGMESGSNISAINATELVASAAVALDSGHRAVPAGEAFAAQHTYDQYASIYNVARSGPYVASEFNPLIELSWKDIEDVYNYRASTLKDYARNVPSAPTKISPHPEHVEEHAPGTNGGGNKQLSDLIDPSILALMPSDDELSRLQHLETAVYMSEEETDIVDEGLAYGVGLGKEDPDATGDRMQAMVGYRPGSESNRLNESRVTGDHPEIPAAESHKLDDGIVDLDAIDIFDNLDEWIDIDKLERGEDPFGRNVTPPPTVVPARNDELSELIKRRIEQAAEVTPDSAPARGLGAKMGGGPAAAPPPAAAAGEQAAADQAPRPRNKFIGGRAAEGAPAVPPGGGTFRAQIPADIRKAQLILGLTSDEMTVPIVTEAWKRQIVQVHPDTGGDKEMAVLLNTAKDTLTRWIEAQAPKLGNKFGKKPPEPAHKDKDKDKDKS